MEVAVQEGKWYKRVYHAAIWSNVKTCSQVTTSTSIESYIGMYAHHGIYAGKNEAGKQMVIHFINTSTGSSCGFDWGITRWWQEKYRKKERWTERRKASIGCTAHRLQGNSKSGKWSTMIVVKRMPKVQSLKIMAAAAVAVYTDRHTRHIYTNTYRIPRLCILRHNNESTVGILMLPWWRKKKIYYKEAKVL